MKRLPLKICGITREQDARLCAEAGAGFAGFIFAAGSPRCVTPERAAALNTGRACRVGVFADTEPEEIRRIMALAGLDYAQLHSGEDPEQCRAVGPERVIKVFWPERLSAVPAGSMAGGTAGAGYGPDDLLAALHRECERFAPVCAMFLLDAGHSGGGSGKSLNFDLLRGFAPPRPWLLAGGLGPRNLAEAAAACAPLAFDCNSGLEEAPGRKNAALVRRTAALLRTLA